jgi:predicted metalloprotease with PDZ domain
MSAEETVLKLLFTAIVVPLLALASPSLGQPMPAEPAPAIAAPRDVPYEAGPMQVAVDATDIDRRIFTVQQTLPVSGPGPLTLLYPEWLPGNHAPRGPLEQLGGLMVSADGQPVTWSRDPVNMYAFHVTVPVGAKALDIAFQFLSPTESKMGRVVVTPDMLNLQWNTVALYPAGYFTRQIQVEPTLRLPEGWKLGTALETAGREGDLVRFKPVSFETLVDSPVFAGRYFRQIDLDPGAPTPVRLNIVADRPGQLNATAEQIAAHRNLVKQAYSLFGAHHYDRYDFLLALSDKMGGIGLEHHRSSENGTTPAYFTEWDSATAGRNRLAHEFTHSWNGKYRRGEDLWTATFSEPMRNSLMWVYEGQTQYWGNVLAARSGLFTVRQGLESLALTAAAYDNRTGRAWRALSDTVNDPIIAARKPLSWRSWQRSEDYYSEGQLIWLDADTLIRQLSGDKRSLDDFAKAFFGGESGSSTPKTYRFEDVVQTLNSVQPYDWAGFLKTRLDSHGPGAPLDGLVRGGYRLVYTAIPSEAFKANENRRKATDLSYCLGLVLDKDGTVSDVAWAGPAYQAGLITGAQVLAVNGVAFDADLLREAVAAAVDPAQAVELLVKSGDRYRTVRLNYTGGLRYPRLEQVPGTRARLDEIYAPKN